MQPMQVHCIGDLLMKNSGKRDDSKDEGKELADVPGYSRGSY